MNIHVGNVYSSDSFYSDSNITDNMNKYGVLGVEMETAGLYYLASKFHVKALSILTVSDHLLTGELTSSEERQTTFNDIIIVALEAAIQE